MNVTDDAPVNTSEKRGRVWGLLDDQTNLLDELGAALDSLVHRVNDIRLVKEGVDPPVNEPLPAMSTLAIRITDHNHVLLRVIDILQVLVTQLEV